MPRWERGSELRVFEIEPYDIVDLYSLNSIKCREKMKFIRKFGKFYNFLRKHKKHDSGPQNSFFEFLKSHFRDFCFFDVRDLDLAIRLLLLEAPCSPTPCT